MGGFMFSVLDQNNHKIQCEILFMFSRNQKNYIVYQDQHQNILSSFYQIQQNNIYLFPIISDEDFNIVEEELRRYQQ